MFVPMTYEIQLLRECGYSDDQINQMTPHQNRNIALECTAAMYEYYED